ncbi:unnamed protein product [Amoebophrya sp. A25]|nr:unnamed protein product [Amoebophrya sp. A25]|eukprot:GSA25T00026014001.1
MPECTALGSAIFPHIVREKDVLRAFTAQLHGKVVSEVGPPENYTDHAAAKTSTSFLKTEHVPSSTYPSSTLGNATALRTGFVRYLQDHCPSAASAHDTSDEHLHPSNDSKKHCQKEMSRTETSSIPVHPVKTKSNGTSSTGRCKKSTSLYRSTSAVHQDTSITLDTLVEVQSALGLDSELGELLEERALSLLRRMPPRWGDMCSVDKEEKLLTVLNLLLQAARAFQRCQRHTRHLRCIQTGSLVSLQLKGIQVHLAAALADLGNAEEERAEASLRAKIRENIANHAEKSRGTKSKVVGIATNHAEKSRGRAASSSRENSACATRQYREDAAAADVQGEGQSLKMISKPNPTSMDDVLKPRKRTLDSDIDDIFYPRERRAWEPVEVQRVEKKDSFSSHRDPPNDSTGEINGAGSGNTDIVDAHPTTIDKVNDSLSWRPQTEMNARPHEDGSLLRRGGDVTLEGKKTSDLSVSTHLLEDDRSNYAFAAKSESKSSFGAPRHNPLSPEMLLEHEDDEPEADSSKTAEGTDRRGSEGEKITKVGDDDTRNSQIRHKNEATGSSHLLSCMEQLLEDEKVRQASYTRSAARIQLAKLGPPADVDPFLIVNLTRKELKMFVEFHCDFLCAHAVVLAYDAMSSGQRQRHPGRLMLQNKPAATRSSKKKTTMSTETSPKKTTMSLPSSTSPKKTTVSSSTSPKKNRKGTAAKRLDAPELWGRSLYRQVIVNRNIAYLAFYLEHRAMCSRTVRACLRHYEKSRTSTSAGTTAGKKVKDLHNKDPHREGVTLFLRLAVPNLEHRLAYARALRIETITQETRRLVYDFN